MQAEAPAGLIERCEDKSEETVRSEGSAEPYWERQEEPKNTHPLGTASFILFRDLGVGP